ncbi:uncharacterized protein CANTADRAFT_280044 [Suhomyces tanzawaensis NRRL Y-17324]|uniref:CAAX prenyl protease n=1 Tax=Suhomyces tanzawaensis NRRL Y-17324 TaxID=984487 RepID=A0A1E4SE25_9ASCO|nr:uncharacterized protein CANTADRAFT_280044 [Suhomyces tanzawaensis NRRL Y-17324]ODV77716.1 hypothetical protein CANTADRAFT_280044 [Suhomyces tanzawaensis NRRL Y-17324]
MFSLAETFSFLDNPNINWKNVILGFTIGQAVFENYLAYRQYQVLKRKTPPVSLKAEVTQETFDKSQDYSRAKARFGFVTDIYNVLQLVATVKYDVLPKLWTVAGSLVQKASPILPSFLGGIITQSLFFVGVQEVISVVLSLPVSYYSNFVLEEKYGFNKLTLGLWISDKLKSFALSVVLGYPILGLALRIFDFTGDSFIAYIMILVLAVQLTFMTIYPLFIQPLFNKFTPLQEGELKTAIENFAAKEKFPLSKLYVIDGSKRSSHSNAYFTGLPWSKQIVLYDTLIDHSTTEETVAVIAHEIGHWKLSHLAKMLVFAQAQIFTSFSLFSAFIRNRSLYNSFGFTTVQPTYIGFLLFGHISTPINLGIQFLFNLLSRKHEYEADEYAKSRGFAEPLAKGLIKLLSENLSSMDADGLYSAYHHSHPILPERLNAIGYISKEKIADIKPFKND